MKLPTKPSTFSTSLQVSRSMLGWLPTATMLGREDAGGAVQGGEGLVELGHVAADRGLAFDQVDLVMPHRRFPARPGCRRCRRRPPAWRRRWARGSASSGRLWRTRSTAPETTALALAVAATLVRVHPGDLLADGRHLAQIGVQAGAVAGGAEGLFVQVRRAGGHHHARQAHLLECPSRSAPGRGWST